MRATYTPPSPTTGKRSPNSKIGAPRRLALGWKPSRALDRPTWLATGMSLAEFGRVNNWWVGDWIRYGNSRWGEKYTDIARITGLDNKTLRNIAYVASRFDLSRRRDNLTWTHHAELAPLEPAQQEQWLDRAYRLHLSPGDLRLELRAAQRALDTSHSHSARDGIDAHPTDTFSCPHCGTIIAFSEIRRYLAR